MDVEGSFPSSFLRMFRWSPQPSWSKAAANFSKSSPLEVAMRCGPKFGCGSRVVDDGRFDDERGEAAIFRNRSATRVSRSLQRMSCTTA